MIRSSNIHRDRRWGSHSAWESDLNKIQPQPSCNFTVGNWPSDGCLQSPFVDTGSTDDGFLPLAVTMKAPGTPDLLGFIWTFLAPKVFFSPAIISSAFCILQFQSLSSRRSHRLPSPTTLAFCLTATLVAIHLLGGPVDCYSSALGCTFVSGSGASLVLGLRPLWGMVKGENLGWGLPCKRFLLVEGSGDFFLITNRCAVQVLLSSLLQHVSMRGCGFHQLLPHSAWGFYSLDGWWPVPTEKELFNATVFSKEQFNAGLQFEPRRSLPILSRVEKASFELLNKLFVIFAITLYILPILPCLAPKVLELDEHHTLNDPPFYEEGGQRKGMARLDRLERKEMLGGTLRQAPGRSRPPLALLLTLKLRGSPSLDLSGRRWTFLVCVFSYVFLRGWYQSRLNQLALPRDLSRLGG
ncbi:hypothetical protein AAG906_037035 [Vitis piasezkii]